MKRLQFALLASLLTVSLSSAAFAGNIGGMRTGPAGTSPTLTTTSEGNIGGPKAEVEGNTAGIILVGNIGGLIRFISTILY